jgi:heavy metal sensor kinase
VSIRIKMTFWYGAVLAAVLAVFGATVYVMMQHQLRTRVDARLTQELSEVMEEVEEASSDVRLKERLENRFNHAGDYELQASNAEGVPIFRTKQLGSTLLPVPSAAKSFKHLDYESVPLGARTVSLGGLGRFRVSSELIPGPSGTVVIQAAISLAPDDHELSELLFVLCLAGPLALACALGGGYLLARKALAPVDHMSKAASEITASHLNRRLDVPNPDDELGRLARTLNEMIGRLERSFEEIRRFTADAAHELRTPLTVLRSEAEVALRSPREPEQYRQVLEAMLEEVERLARLAEQLLFLSRKDAGLVPRVREPLRLDTLAEDVAELMRVIAEEKRLTLAADDLAPSHVVADEDQLRRVLVNLVDNAIKFTPPGGTVTIRCETAEDRVRLAVTDTGIGIAAEHLPHIFERFYRVDPSRSREAGGTGLGLAIGRAIAEAHSGCIRIESTVGVGTEATLVLPALGSPAAPAPRPRQDVTPRPDQEPTVNGHELTKCDEKKGLGQCSR